MLTLNPTDYIIPERVIPVYENGYLRKGLFEPRYYVLNEGDGTKFDHPSEAVEWFETVTVGELIKDGWTEFKNSILGVFDDGETVTITELNWTHDN